jgi:anthranilate synthase component 1
MLDLQPPSFEAFEREARQGNVVPVVRSVLADLHTPVGAFMRIAGNSPYSFLLESVEGGERIARYSFLGAEPEMIVRGKGLQTIVERDGKTESYLKVATEWVRDYFRGRSLARRPGLVPFAGGAVGYIGYDAAQWFEPALRDDTTQSLDPPTDAVWMFFRNVIAFDRVKQRLEIVSIVLTEEAGGSHERLRELYDQAVARTKEVERPIFETALRRVCNAQRERENISLQSNWTRRAFEDGVRQVKEHIAAGDCYQVVLSQRFSAQFTAIRCRSIEHCARSIHRRTCSFCARRRDCRGRVAGDARALSWTATRLSPDRGHEKTWRDRDGRLDVERGSEDGRERDRGAHDAGRSRAQRSRARFGLRFGEG